MESKYNVDPEWISNRPGEIRRKRTVAIIASAMVFLISLFLSSWVGFFVTILAAIYVIVELKKREIQYEDLYVKILDSGLFQSTPDWRGRDPMVLFTPWECLVVDGVKKKGGTIESIRLVDTTLPRGVGTIKIQHLERMDELFSEIRARVGAARAGL